jgi:VanZ family protein
MKFDFGSVLGWIESRRNFATFLAAAYAVGIFYFSSLSYPPTPAWAYSAVVFHFAEYLGFGFVLFLAARSWRVRRAFAVALVFAVFYAATDEVHQYFVPYRSCSLFDVLVDSLGALAGTILYSRIRR